MKGANAILWDAETSQMLVTTFSLYPESIGHHNILSDWYIFCICYKRLGENRVHSISITDDPKRFKKNPKDDYYVVKTMADVLRDADYTIGHNEQAFDRKKLNARLIYHGLAPLPTIPSVDTLKEVRKIAKFSSNRLDYLGEHLGFGGKVRTSDGLWLRALTGDTDAIEEMVKYCKGDVKLLEQIYLKLMPYMKTHPHVGALTGSDRNESCSKCGSKNLKKSKVNITAAGIKKRQWQCLDCGGYTTTSIKEE